MGLRTNSLGFRGPEPSAPPRGGVVFVGDSFTLGYGVNDGEEFPAVLAERLAERGVSVVNAGVGNCGNGRWLKLLRHELPALEPRVVVFQVCGNDPADNAREKLYRLTDADELEELPVPAPSGGRLVQGVVEAIPGLPYSRLLGFVRQAYFRRTPNQTAPTPAAEGLQPRERLTLRLIEAALDDCASRSWATIVLSVALEGRPLEALRAGCAQRKVLLIEIPPKSERPDLYFEVDGHWRAEGHRFVAERVGQALLAHPVLR